MEEEWRQIESFPEYIVSNLGKVMNIDSKKKTRQYPTYNGYLRVELKNREMKCQKRVHSLVLNAFVGPQPEGKECNHIDCNKNNNSATNLEYVTRKENIHHAIQNGKHPFVSRNEPLSKRLDKEDIKSIKELLLSGAPRRFIAQQFGISRTSVCRMVLGYR